MLKKESPKFINPFTDFGFKKIFGEEANKDLLIDFLNELLAKENEKIQDLTYKKNEQLGQSGIDRHVVYDLHCVNEKGERFIVELQKAKQAFFKDRMIFYSSFLLQQQGKKGDWNYRLKAVYTIAILDFIINDDDDEKTIVSNNKLMDIENHKVFYDKLSFITIEMPNFNKTVNELETNFDKWLYVIKNLRILDRVPDKLKNKIFSKLFDVASYAQLSKAERQKYHDSLKYYNDLKNSLDTAFDNGKAEGVTETKEVFKSIISEKNKELKQERQKAEQERQKAEQKDKELKLERQKAEQKDKELKQERQKAEQERQRINTMIRNMKKAGISISEISKITGRTEEEIEKI